MRLSLLAAALLCSVCSALPRAPCSAGAQALVADELFFGLSIPGGGSVGEDQWQAFLRDDVTPRFPQGLSVVDAAGQWRGSDGDLVRERARVVTLAHPGDAASEARVSEIIAVYKTRFSQESVLRLTQPACATF